MEHMYFIGFKQIKQLVNDICFYKKNFSKYLKQKRNWWRLYIDKLNNITHIPAVTCEDVCESISGLYKTLMRYSEPKRFFATVVLVQIYRDKM